MSPVHDRAQMLDRLAEHEDEERNAVGQDAAQKENDVDSSNPEALQPRYEGSRAETISAWLLRFVYSPGDSSRHGRRNQFSPAGLMAMPFCCPCSLHAVPSLPPWNCRLMADGSQQRRPDR